VELLTGDGWSHSDTPLDAAVQLGPPSPALHSPLVGWQDRSRAAQLECEGCVTGRPALSAAANARCQANGPNESRLSRLCWLVAMVFLCSTSYVVLEYIGMDWCNMLPQYRKGLLALFGRLRKLAATDPYNAAEYLAIQELLIKRITYVEGRIKAARESMSEARRALRERLPKEESRRIKRSIAYAKQWIVEYEHLLHVYRCIGDALIFLNVQRWAIPVMMTSPTAGFISGKTGLKAEIKALRAYAASGTPAVLNDLTNVMRHADITIIYKGYFRLAEVKSGGYDRARMRRQLGAAREAWDFLAGGEREDPRLPGIKIHGSRYHAPERDCVPQLNTLISDAMHHGQAFGDVEIGLSYLITGWATNDIVDVLRGALDGKRHPFSFILNGRKFDIYGYYPFTLSIHDPDAIYAFYSGALVITVVVDRAALVYAAAEQGVDVRFTTDKEYPLEIMAREQGDSDKARSIMVGWHFYHRLAYEFLSLRWFVDELVYRAKTPLSEQLRGEDDSHAPTP
jgi:hypothetical protein